MDFIVVTYANMPSQGMYTHEPTSPQHGEREWSMGGNTQSHEVTHRRLECQENLQAIPFAHAIENPRPPSNLADKFIDLCWDQYFERDAPRN